MILKIPEVADFELHDPKAPWSRSPLYTLNRSEQSPLPYNTTARILWSEIGLYFQIECEDEVLTTTGLPDWGDLYLEDVVEVFLWTDPSQPLYFEYEISPMASELAILVPNHKGDFHGWLAWHFVKDRLTRKRVLVKGGPQQPGAQVQSWTAEFFIPFKLFLGLGNMEPKKGDQWRGNICRMDYGAAERSYWSLEPTIQTNFHEFEKFPIFIFD
jgi:hypothetical protein